jgi:hypothetical protein
VLIEKEKTVKINITINVFSDHFEAAENSQSVFDYSFRTISIIRNKHQ